MSELSIKDGRVFGLDISGINKLMPIKNKFAWECYHKGLANNWVPTKIPMQIDIQQWKNPLGLSDDERFLLKRCLGFFAGAESLVGNNLILSIFRDVTDPDCRQYIIRQAFEESLHNLTVVYICDSLGLDEKEIYEAYRNIPAIRAKDEFLIDITRTSANTLKTGFEAKQEALRNIITYYIICEGIFFYSGFAMLFNFKRHNKMPGIAKQIEYTIRDESVHIEFGVHLIQLIREQEDIWTEQFEKDTIDHIKRATELEIKYAYDVLPRGILGLNAEMFVDYMKYISNRRCQMIGLEPIFEDRVSPFPWLSEVIDLRKNENFFETTVLQYQTGTLQDDLE